MNSGSSARSARRTFPRARLNASRWTSSSGPAWTHPTTTAGTCPGASPLAEGAAGVVTAGASASGAGGASGIGRNVRSTECGASGSGGAPGSRRAGDEAGVGRSWTVSPSADLAGARPGSGPLPLSPPSMNRLLTLTAGCLALAGCMSMSSSGDPDPMPSDRMGSPQTGPMVSGPRTP